MIPKIIHQTWKSSEVPEKFAGYVATWKSLHPDWEYRLWTDADARSFIAEEYPWFLDTFDGYPDNIARADAIRYFVLFHFGGLYADLDYECLRPMDDLFDGAACVLGTEPSAHARYLYGVERLITNAFMASEPGHPLWERVFEEMESAKNKDSVMVRTGPVMLDKVVNAHESEYNMTINPPVVLSPKLDIGNIRLTRRILTAHLTGRHKDIAHEMDDSANAHAIHHWAHTWIIPRWISYPVNLAILLIVLWAIFYALRALYEMST